MCEILSPADSLSHFIFYSLFQSLPWNSAIYSAKRYFARPFTQATGDGLVYKLTRASVVQSYTCVQLWEMINEYPSFKMNSWTNTYIPNVNKKKSPHIMLLINSIISFEYANVI